jgi:hypothetical protein
MCLKTKRWMRIQKTDISEFESSQPSHAVGLYNAPSRTPKTRG